MTKEQYFRIDEIIITKTNLTLVSRVLYCYISNYWKQGLNVFATNKHLSAAIGVSESSISRALRQLKDHGLIKVKYFKDENNIETRLILKPKTNDSELMKMFKRVIENKNEWKGGLD